MNISAYHFIQGSAAALEAGLAATSAIPVDEERLAPAGWEPPKFAFTIGAPCSVTGPGTYSRGVSRTLEFLPSREAGWRFQRTDLPLALPVPVALESVSASDRAIILRSGRDANRVRMTEHIICHRLGLGIDNLTIRCSSEDPPLFDCGSMPIVEALQNAGLQETSVPLPYYTVKKPAAWCAPNGAFLLWLPAENGCRKLTLDAAIDFPTAIGRQRIIMDLHPEAFAYGAQARTNCSARQMFLAKTVGRIFSRELRNMGYTDRNILVAGKDKYVTAPTMVLENGKSVEAVWHRTCLDLIAALSLLPEGRPAGRIISYKAGHTLDVNFLTALRKEELLTSL